MLDVFDFIAEKGGDPKKIKESQRRRYAPEEDVDEVVRLYEDARATKYAASQAKQQINAVQKEIQTKKKVSLGDNEHTPCKRQLIVLDLLGQGECR